MGERREVVEAKRAEVLAAVHRHRGRSVALFGSAARGDDVKSSDVDLLVEFEAGSSLFDLLHLQDELTLLLGCAVDVVSAGGLTDRDDRIRRESVRL